MFNFSKDYMPFGDIYVSTFKNDIEYKQLLIQTAMALQTNKFIQVSVKEELLGEALTHPTLNQLSVPQTFCCWIHFKEWLS